MKISIITATFNSEKTLRPCLDSVKQQSAIDSIEHIIVDGQSTDATLAIASEYPHIDKIVSAKDRGIYHAFNKGVALATGDLVYFLNSDDQLYDNSVIHDVLSSMTPELDFYCGTILSVNESTGESYFSTSYNNQTNTENFKPRHQAFFCKRQLFDTIGPFNECLNIAADTYFMKKTMKLCTGIFTERTVAKFSLEGISSNNENTSNVLTQDLIVDTLLGLSSDYTKLPEKLALQNKNSAEIKRLMLKIIQNKVNIETLANKKVAIFGTRELSQFIYYALNNICIDILCFIETSPKKNSIKNIIPPIISFNELPILNPDIIINCIEGNHKENITDMLKNALPSVSVISWQEL